MFKRFVTQKKPRKRKVELEPKEKVVEKSIDYWKKVNPEIFELPF